MSEINNNDIKEVKETPPPAESTETEMDDDLASELDNNYDSYMTDGNQGGDGNDGDGEEGKKEKKEEQDGGDPPKPPEDGEGGADGGDPPKPPEGGEGGADGGDPPKPPEGGEGGADGGDPPKPPEDGEGGADGGDPPKPPEDGEATGDGEGQEDEEDIDLDDINEFLESDKSKTPESDKSKTKESSSVNETGEETKDGNEPTEKKTLSKFQTAKFLAAATIGSAYSWARDKLAERGHKKGYTTFKGYFGGSAFGAGAKAFANKLNPDMSWESRFASGAVIDKATKGVATRLDAAAFKRKCEKNPDHNYKTLGDIVADRQKRINDFKEWASRPSPEQIESHTLVLDEDEVDKYMGNLDLDSISPSDYKLNLESSEDGEAVDGEQEGDTSEGDDSQEDDLNPFDKNGNVH